MASLEERKQIALKARQQQMQIMATRRQQQPQRKSIEPSDLGWIGERPTHITSFDSRNLTQITLHDGLLSTLRAGHIEAARVLLQLGTPIIPTTPETVLSAPIDHQLPLFDLLAHHGWDINTPDQNGAVLLPQVVKNTQLLRWLLAYGAHPNLGSKGQNCCEALESAARTGTVEAVQILMDAGAQINNGATLHYAAGACSPGANPHMGTDRMELLVEYGEDVNQKLESRHMNPDYPLVYAVMAGAVERVKWLLKYGADVRLKGAFGSAVE
ncbi:hypothetical protein N7490_007127 [Penicillium lividum]|nr:hypothetical protein N7490_007127 [Penicillium lividum]